MLIKVSEQVNVEHNTGTE